MDEELLAKLGAPICQFCGALIDKSESKKQQAVIALRTISAVLQIAPVSDSIVDDVMGESGFAESLRRAIKKPVFCQKCLEVKSRPDTE